jgi:hypothetical protein
VIATRLTSEMAHRKKVLTQYLLHIQISEGEDN